MYDTYLLILNMKYRYRCSNKSATLNIVRNRHFQ